MSLDIDLLLDHTVDRKGSGIYVRENGQTREISRFEWDRKNPGIDPVVCVTGDTNSVYSANITDNLGAMANVAGLYEALWCPENIGCTRAGQLIDHLTQGLITLLKDPEKFEEYNPSNGWGDYYVLVDFVTKYAIACKRWPEAKIEVCR